MIEKHIILNYDLGLKGDYSSLYAFLDNRESLDIGNSNAAFAMEFTKDDFETIFNELKEKLNSVMSIEKTDRIYMIVTDSTCNMRGRFISGSRKRAVWEGYGVKEDEGFDQF